MALDPVVMQGMDVRQLQKPVPQVGIEGGLFVGLDPAPLLPARGPALGQSVDDILGIGPQLHNTGLFEQGQSRNDGGKLHAVVGGVGLTAGEFLAVGSIHQNGAPASGTGIAGTGAVGIDRDSFHLASLLQKVS